jgi:hypothetical protein
MGRITVNISFVVIFYQFKRTWDLLFNLDHADQTVSMGKNRIHVVLILGYRKLLKYFKQNNKLASSQQRKPKCTILTNLLLFLK